MNEAECTWAANLLSDLAACLTIEAQEIQALRKAGVSESRISSLYPFDANAWMAGIFELTYGIEPYVGYDLGPTPTAVQQVFELLHSAGTIAHELANSLDRACHTSEFVIASNQAHDPDSPSPEADALHLAIILLHMCATNQVQVGGRASDEDRWAYNFPRYQQLMDRIARVLDEEQWVARNVLA